MPLKGSGRLAIHGSCVSRDLVSLSLRNTAESIHYVARQSFISTDRPTQIDREIPEFAHAFQTASFKSDLKGDGVSKIVSLADSIDGVLIDIVDERHGVYFNEIDGSVITRSVDAVNSGFYETLAGWTYIDFGTRHHLELFAFSIAQLKNRLLTSGLLNRTFVLMTPWASKLESGAPTPPSMGKSASLANSIIPEYIEVFASLGFQVLAPDPDTVIGDSKHKWGAAPFHYIPEFYESLAKQMGPLLTRTS